MIGIVQPYPSESLMHSNAPVRLIIAIGPLLQRSGLTNLTAHLRRGAQIEAAPFEYEFNPVDGHHYSAGQRGRRLIAQDNTWAITWKIGMLDDRMNWPVEIEACEGADLVVLERLLDWVRGG